MATPGYIVPHWPAPANVRAVMTTRYGGFSQGPFHSFNLAEHVGDAPGVVLKNRQKLVSDWQLKQSPQWLNQTHSTIVINLDQTPVSNPEGDAAITTKTEMPCVVMTADCLPVFLCAGNGREVAIAHAGWRGLAGGILRQTIGAMTTDVNQLLAYLGPAISQQHFEVGVEVQQTFQAEALNGEHAKKIPGLFRTAEKDGKLLADLYGLARLELACLGVQRVYGGEFCTYSDEERFYSYRREGETGRMASVIWLEW